MSAPHTATMKLAQVEATKKGWRLFVNSIGLGWIGTAHSEHMDSKAGHVVTLTHARRLRFGLCQGSFDLIGFRTLEVTPDMVGRKIAQFCAVDAKTGAYRKLSPEQLIFARNVQGAGGFAGIAMIQPDGQVAIGEIGGE